MSNEPKRPWYSFRWQILYGVLIAVIIITLGNLLAVLPMALQQK